MNQAKELPPAINDPGMSVYNSSYSLDLFLNNLPDVVIITDPRFIIKGFNHVAEKFFDLPASHFIGSRFMDKVKFEFRNTSREVFMKTLYKTGMWRGKIIFNRRDNQQYVFHSNVSLLYDEKGSVNSIILVNQNITDTDNQEKKLALIETKYKAVVESLSEGVIVVNSDGTIGTANQVAADIFGLSKEELSGFKLYDPLWKATKIDGAPFPPQDFPAIFSLRTGESVSNVIMAIERKDGTTVWISMNSRPIFQEDERLPYKVVASFKDITNERNAADKLMESEIFFRSFMTNSPTLGWIYDEQGNFVYGNPLFIKRAGLQNASIGESIFNISSPEMAKKIFERNQQVVKTGESMISEDELIMNDGTSRYFVANWFLIPGNGQTYIGGQAIEITERKNAEKEIEKMHERFSYVVNASSDAIWDVDLLTNEIYRSDAFSQISGYAKEEIEPTLDWWFDKIHPEDKERVNNKIEMQLLNGARHWNDEYRFQHADGSYRFICDKGFTIYENDVATRQVGSMVDITDRKNLEVELLHEQVQKQKLINQATINAQEEERNRISAELHDNVNQLIMSARLHIGVAKNNIENQDKILDKATGYLLMAVEEIRSLSKMMNSKVVTSIGLLESIADIVYNIQEINHIEVKTDINISIIEKLSSGQQLMIFRIVQEQTANIIKHAEATKVHISLNECKQDIHMTITDNGKGFDPEKQKFKGIGHINIFNRVDAYNGNMEIISSPGNGCKLNICFPVNG